MDATMNNTTVTKAIIMLGKTVPEPTNERTTQYVCSCGLSVEGEQNNALVRLYPLSLRSAPARWSLDIYQLDRHPGNKDSRPETWKPAARTHVTDISRDKVQPMLKQFIVSGIVEANERRMSLAIVAPQGVRFLLSETTTEEPSYQLFDDSGLALKTKERFKHVPRFQFRTEDGRPHNLQFRDWGTYELLRKKQLKLAEMNDEQRTKYVEAACCKAEPLFLIGNYASHRNSWLIIASL